MEEMVEDSSDDCMSDDEDDSDPPHIFKLAARAFSELQLDRRSQAILVLGESGAGKTETTEAVLEIL